MKLIFPENSNLNVKEGKYTYWPGLLQIPYRKEPIFTANFLSISAWTLIWLVFK